MSGSLEWCVLCHHEWTLALHRDIWWSIERRRRLAPDGALFQSPVGVALLDSNVARAFEAHLRRSRALIARGLGDRRVIGRTAAELAAEAASRGVSLQLAAFLCAVSRLR
jgi:hypothetical protein